MATNAQDTAKSIAVLPNNFLSKIALLFIILLLKKIIII